MILAVGMIEPTCQVAVFVAFRVASALPTLRWPFAGALVALVANLADLFLATTDLAHDHRALANQRSG